jgi:hypothetical protein
MTEKILKIEEFDESWAGFKITTNIQVITLEIYNESSCCESWGYFWSNDNVNDFIGATLLGVKIVDDALNVRKFYEESGNLDEGDVMFVNLETDKGTLQFTAYTSHNGYYAHTAKVTSNQLTIEEWL